MKRLREMGVDLPEGTRLQRSYAGHWQRIEGAWSWFAIDPEWSVNLGSQWPMSHLLKAPYLMVTGDKLIGMSVDPMDDQGRFWWGDLNRTSRS